jgi:1-acyl-sn-glycerol-3-phosphate acyltransferase
LSVSLSVQEYVARQPRIAWRRHVMRWLIRQLPFRMVRLTVSGLEHIPPAGPTILMMNHISAIDPGLCMGAVTHRFVVPMTKVENTYHPLGRLAVWWWGSYTVTRGEADRKALLNSIELLKSGQLILIAPEGTRQQNGLARPKDGLAYIATKADAIIVPAGISGAVGWQEKWQRFERPAIQLTFGRAFKFNTGGEPRVARDALAAMTEEAMYQLALAVEPGLRGVYSDTSKATARYLTFIE